MENAEENAPWLKSIISDSLAARPVADDFSRPRGESAQIRFLDEHMKGLRQAGIVTKNGDDYSLWEGALFEAFAQLPFTLKRGFSFTRVRGFVRRSKKPI